MRCLTSCRIHGHEIAPNDLLELEGNLAVQMTRGGHLAFIDGEARAQEESRLFAAAKKLGLPEDLKKLAAFGKPEKGANK